MTSRLHVPQTAYTAEKIGFTAEELAANREGHLALSQQLAILRQNRRRRAWCVAGIVGLVGLTVLYFVSYPNTDATHLAVVIGMAVIGVPLALHGWRSERATRREIDLGMVDVVEGVVFKEAIAQEEGEYTYRVHIYDQTFRDVPETVHDGLEAGRRYRVHSLRGRILSFEAEESDE
jgi:hypothetical protein